MCRQKVGFQGQQTAIPKHRYSETGLGLGLGVGVGLGVGLGLGLGLGVGLGLEVNVRNSGVSEWLTQTIGTI